MAAQVEDVEIENVDGDYFPPHRAPPKNQDIDNMIHIAGELLAQYGWHLLFLTMGVYLLIRLFQKRRSRQRDQFTQQPAQDAVFVARRQEAMEAARRKMQEELDAKSAVFREKQKQQEEERRKQKIEMWESMQQGKSTKGAARLSQNPDESDSSSAVLKPKKPLRSADYNPLTGQGGGSCSWRLNRRGPSSGG